MGALALAALVPAAIAVAPDPAAAGPRQPGLLPPRVARRLAPTFASYALFGAGYVSYMTFIIVLVRQAGGGAAATSGYWILLGLSSIAGTLLWGRLLAARRAPASASGSSPSPSSIGALPVLLWPGLPAACLSAVIFGGSFMSGPMAITILVRRLLAARARHRRDRRADLGLRHRPGRRPDPLRLRHRRSPARSQQGSGSPPSSSPPPPPSRRCSASTARHDSRHESKGRGPRGASPLPLLEAEAFRRSPRSSP